MTTPLTFPEVLGVVAEGPLQIFIWSPWFSVREEHFSPACMSVFVECCVLGNVSGMLLPVSCGSRGTPVWLSLLPGAAHVGGLKAREAQ